MKIINKAPVLILGGGANALSLIRSFGRQDIPVNACPISQIVLRSRYCDRRYPLPTAVRPSAYFEELTLSGKHPELHGSVIFSCSDDALEFVARHHAELKQNFLLERNDPALQLELLDKERTLVISKAANIPTPGFATVNTLEDLDGVETSLRPPLILKPHNTHAFKKLYGAKYLSFDDLDALRHKADELLRNDIGFMVCEMIPGPDSANCSYYTYRDASGHELLSLTKRCVRRIPINEGAGTYQITEHLPDVEALGKRFFESLNYTGLGNLEFKRDPRDGELKVMECNNRFTAVQTQLVAAGVDAALIAYADITNQPVIPQIGCEEFVAIWSPMPDLRAFRQVKERDGSSWLDWLRSMSHRKVVFPMFSWSDPMPFAVAVTRRLRKGIQRRLFPRSSERRASPRGSG